MKIAAVFLSNSYYLEGAKVCIFSFLENNKWFNGDFIIYLTSDVPYCEELNLKNIFKGIIVKRVKENDYERLISYSKTHIFGVYESAFYKFEVFGEEKYDKVIFIDSDMLIISSIKELVDNSYDMLISIDSEVYDMSFGIKKREKENINSGLFVIGKKYLNQETRNDLINYSFNYNIYERSERHPNRGLYADQDVIYGYFFDKEFYLSSNIYNYRFFHVNDNIVKKIKNIHYIGENKPWINSDVVNGQYWFDYQKRLYSGLYSMNSNGDKYYFKKYDDRNKNIVCACAKNEDEYILEWVKHHLDIGFDKIIIADNNDDCTILPQILKEYISSGKVQIFICSGLKNIQLNIYSMMTKEPNYKWMACFDVDEFFEFSGRYRNLKELFDEVEGDTLLVNWLMYGPDGQIYKKEGTVQERFKNPVSPIILFKENMFFKPIIKNTVKNCSFTSSHEPLFDGNGGTYNIGGYCLTDNVYQVSYPLRYKKAWLKHYYTKSFNEYQAKVNRGWPDGNDVKRLSNMNHYFLMDSSDTFNMAKFTEHIFHDGSHSWVWDVVKEYDVVAFLNPAHNYFALYFYLGKAMSLVTDKTFIVEESTDDTVFCTLLEIALKTGNRLIARNNDIDAYWYIYERFRKEKNNNNKTYYVVTVS